MHKLTRLLIGVSVTVALAAAVPALGVAATPVIRDHLNFTSDPYDDSWCGIDGTSVDRVVVQYKEDATGASIENDSIKTLFTATASGKSMEIVQTGVRKRSAPVDNGDGTFSVVVSNRGLSPAFKLPNGPPIVLDVGLVEFRVTFDAATGDFVSFEVLRVRGPRPPGCDAIIAALT